LAEYGADVLHISSNASIPEVPFLPAFYNNGKHCADLNLRLPADRAKFEELLDEVDIVVDGYRPGALEKLGYGKDALVKRFQARNKGFIYVAVSPLLNVMFRR
jgi:crotonobetainyl-CoA:carnitine CoA-transferase CaiB-like acyl-CoA transferase